MTPPVHVAIISSGRPGNVPAMEHWCAGLDPTWYVNPDDGPDYSYAGAVHIDAAGPGLCAARNRALVAARDGGRPCLQLSDDLRALGWAQGRTRDTVYPLTVGEATEHLLDALEATPGARLAGVAPTANPYFSKPRIHTHAFVVGDMCLVHPETGLLFDECLRLKEDYDYTLQHLTEHGVVARVDQLLATFTHRTNKGGAVAVRTPAVEQESIARLMAKWPGALRPNPRRANEVLLRWKPST